jgi:hypothetical protein
MFNDLKQKVRPYIPFTSLNTVWRHLDAKGKTLLDVGCGKVNRQNSSIERADTSPSASMHLSRI